MHLARSTVSACGPFLALLAGCSVPGPGTWTEIPERALTVTVAPDARTAAYATRSAQENVVGRVDLERGAPMPALAIPIELPDYTQALAWDPRGELLAVGSWAGRLLLLKPDGTQVREVTLGPATREEQPGMVSLKASATLVGRSLVWAPDGSVLAISLLRREGADITRGAILLMDRAGGDLRQLDPGCLSAPTLAISPDSATLFAFQDDGHLRAWTLATGEQVSDVRCEWATPSVNARALTLAADQVYVAGGDGDHSILARYDQGTGRLVWRASLPGGCVGVQAVRGGALVAVLCERLSGSTVEGELLFLSATDGTPRARHELSRDPQALLALSGGERVVVARAYAIGVVPVPEPAAR